MNKYKKWYSLLMTMIILLSTIIQPIQVIAATITTESGEAEVKALNVEQTDEANRSEETTAIEENQVDSSSMTDSSEKISETMQTTEISNTVESTEISATDSTETSTSSSDDEALKKAKALAERAPINIKDVMDSSESFITGVEISVYEGENKVDYEKQAISPNAIIGLKYNFELPQRLIDEQLIKANDFFDIDLPSQINIKNVSGPLKHPITGDVFGNYSMSNGKVRITFNDKIESLNDISGDFFYSESLNQTIDAGENIIKIPVGSEEKSIHLNIRPNGGNAISKSVKTGEDNKTITWYVSINTNLSSLKNATVTDPLPSGTTLKNLSIYTQKVDMKGSPKAEGSQLILGTDYLLEGDVVTFIGKYAETNESFKLVYETIVNEDSIPEAGGDVPYKNTATLTNDNQSLPASAETKKSYGKLIDKSNASRDTSKPGYVYNWTVKYNYGYKELPKNSSITDSLEGSNLVYVEDSVVVKTEAGQLLTNGTDYQVSFEEKQMVVSFPNGLNTAVKIDYQTKVPFIVDGDTSEIALKNNVKTDTGATSGGSGQIDKNGVTKDASVNYKDRTIDWKITVNRYQYEMFNWELKDTMSDGLTFDKTKFSIKTNDKTLVEDTDYVFVSNNEKEFHVKFIGDLATSGTNKMYTITYTTAFNRYQEKFNNKATTTWQDENKKNYTQSAEKNITIKNEYVADATKGGSYNGQSKTITWKTVVNYNQDVLKNATIIDPIIGDQTYVKNSAKIYEVTLKNDGSYQLGSEVPNVVTVTDKVVSAKLPEDSTKVYMLVFETSLEGKLIQKEAYKNTATYKNGQKTKEVSATVSVTNGGNLATKSGKQDDDNANYAKWSIMINPTQSTLTDVKIVDEPSTNQVLEEESIVIFATTVDTNGNSKKNEQMKLEKGKDYSADIVTDNITGKQVLTVTLTEKIERAYVLEYRTLINSNKVTDTLSNKMSMTANNEEVVKWETESSSKVSVSGGSSNGSKASVKIVKVDKNTKERTPLPDAFFELWSINDKGGKGTLIRSGKTDTQGEVKFGNLRANYDYLLFETKAPKGFSVSEELKKGKKVKFKPDADNTSLFEELVIQNDIPRIQFQKIDEKSRTNLAGAVFTVKNSDGNYYNGLNGKYEVQWVENKKDISKEVKNQLTSTNNGTVEVAGLTVGDYSVEELVAPDGYDRTNTITNFTVVDDAGVIRLKNPIQPITNKAYETTQLSVQKNWDDQNNQDGKRPEKVVVSLLINGEKSNQTIELNQDNNWQNSFSELRKYDTDMKEITYTVEEKQVTDYTLTKQQVDQNGTVQLTNTHEIEKTQIGVSKIWKDNDNQDGIRTKEVIIHLLANGKETNQKLILNEDNKWSARFENLDVYQNQAKINYTVEEESIEGYTQSISGNSDAGFVVTNTHEAILTSVAGNKSWKDADDQDGKRPESIIVNLVADGEVVDHVTVNEKSNWAFEFKNLAKFNAGNEIEYKIQEVSVKDYSTTISGYNLLNTHTPDKTAINVIKQWNDKENQDGIRPESIQVELFADGQKTGKTLTLTEETNWQGDFTDLDVYQNKKEIEYTIQEATVKGYETAITGNSETGFIVANTHKPEEVSVNVSKIWEDANNQDGKRSDEVLVQLIANNEEVGEPLSLSADNDWEQTWTQLPLRKTGKLIEYSVKELSEIPGYETTIKETKANNFVITNSHTPSEITISGKKVWEDADNQDGIRPEVITINLLANGKKVTSQEVKESTDKTNWAYSFKDLPEFKEGKKIEYTVTEDSVEKYTTDINGYTITNTYIPQVTEVAVTKEWDDANNQDGKRSDLITVELLADGKETGKTLELSNATNWQATFDNLALKASGKLITYTVKEITAIDGYTTDIVYSKDKDGVKAIITNTHTPERLTLSGQKTWDDANDQDGKRPDSIQLNLLANGEKVAELTASEKTDWQYEFKNLPKFEKGIEIQYHLQEVIVEDYSASINKFDITNTHTPDKTAINVIKQWNDADNQDGIRPESIQIELLANGEKTGNILTLTDKTNWQGEFTDLDVYQNKKEIKYAIQETTVEGYETAITGNPKTGFIVTNTHEVALKEVLGNKTWVDNDNQDGKRPDSIKVNLLADGVPVESVTVSEETKWTYQFKELDKFKAGKEIVYTVSEDEVDGYETTIDGYDIINTHIPEKLDINVTKVWEDADNQDGLRAKEVTIHLIVNGEKSKETLILNEEVNWQGNFADLAAYKNGKKITYSISEDEVENYQSVISGDSKTGFIVTNTHEVIKTNVEISKEWIDDDDKDGIRPGSVTIEVTADGKDTVEVVTTNPDTNWHNSVKDLPVYDKGKEIKYDITSVTIKGYTTKVTGDSKTGFVVTSKHVSNQNNHSSNNSSSHTGNSTKSGDLKNNQKGSLPQTGETVDRLVILLGLLLTLITFTFYLKRKE